MKTFMILTTLGGIVMLVIQTQILKKLMAIDEQLATIKAKLDEAATEILAELESLRGHVISSEGQAILDAIQTKVNALADVSPPVS